MKRGILAALGVLTFALWASAAPATVKFSCLWWSPEQMTGINMDAPPPKQTEVEIAKWEYSDPVGVPNPDAVFVKVVLKDLKAKQTAKASIKYRFKVGKMSKKASAKWQPLQTLDAGSVELVPGQVVKVGEVPIKPTMDALFAKDLWPHELEVQVVLVDPSDAKKVISAGKGVLPIVGGD